MYPERKALPADIMMLRSSPSPHILNLTANIIVSPIKKEQKEKPNTNNPNG